MAAYHSGYQNMPSQIKQMMLKQTTERFRQGGDFVFFGFHKLTVVESGTLRATLAKTGGSAFVLKNALATRAMEALGYDKGLAACLKGPTAVAWSKDAASMAKALIKFEKDSSGKIGVRGGHVEGQTLNAAQIKMLSELPSREELLGRITGMARSPARRLAAAAKAPAARIAGCIKTLADKKEEKKDSDKDA
jgi:large subunit ribosomal protein L10